MVHPQTAAIPSEAVNKIRREDHPVHAWYRFVLAYPPHLVRDYLERFGVTGQQRVLDPFCGTGTTLVECKKRGVPSVGIEANPMAQMACQVKMDWSIDAQSLQQSAGRCAEQALAQLHAEEIKDEPRPENSARLSTCRTLPAETARLLLTNSISALPLHKILVLRDQLDRVQPPLRAPLQLALAKALVVSISNLHFGPKVGVGKQKADGPVIAPWLEEVGRMAADLDRLQEGPFVTGPVHQVHLGDARELGAYLQPDSVDAVITSPPYPNEKDYTRTTRLESVLLGLIQSKAELQALKRSLVRSNTRGVYKNDADDAWVADHPEIQRIAAAIEARRIEMGKTSGFERQYARVARLYFGGMRRHLANLRPFLRPGAQLAYVVGDQASYLRIMIRTGQLLADLAQTLGYEVRSLDLFRTRRATATGELQREEVVVLRWPAARVPLQDRARPFYYLDAGKSS